MKRLINQLFIKQEVMECHRKQDNERTEKKSKVSNLYYIICAIIVDSLFQKRFKNIFMAVMNKVESILG
jgi:hypothetical protein